MRVAPLAIVLVLGGCQSGTGTTAGATATHRGSATSAPAAPGSAAPTANAGSATAPKGPLWWKEVLPAAGRADAARRVASTFPPEWQPRVVADELAFPSEVELRLPEPLTDANAVDRVLEIIRPRAALFGIQKPDAAKGVLRYGEVWIYEGERWTGALHARFDGRKVTLLGHLWPWETPAVSAAGIDRVLKPFIGLSGSEPSRCICPHDKIAVTLTREMFVVTPGVALVCREHVLTATPAITLRAIVATYSDIPGLDKLPRLVDARTLEPIPGDFWMLPHGELAESGPVFGVGDEKWLGDHCINQP